MSREISKFEDVIDSRDVIDRIAYLEQEMADISEECSEQGIDCVQDDDILQEYEALVALAEEGSDSPDWEHGETLIRDSYFREYAEQLADDMGLQVSNEWPFRHIDWDAAARELQADYASVDFDGVMYWIHQ